MRILLGLAAALDLAADGSVALAQDAVLTVTDGKQTVELKQAELAAMKQDVIETSSPWTEGTVKFSGPTFTEILNTVGLAGETVTTEALDGYSVEIPRAALTGDGAILALSMNDAPLPADKAPFWIVFPYDQSPEMSDEAHQSWSAWAVKVLTIK